MTTSEQSPPDDARPEQSPPDDDDAAAQHETVDITAVVAGIRDLAEAIEKLTHRPVAPSAAPTTTVTGVEGDGYVDPDEVQARRRRERTDFSYRALGTMMGRTSRVGRDFDVKLFAARWGARNDVIRLRDVPRAAEWIELRTGGKVERLRIVRASRQGEQLDAADSDRQGKPLPYVEPKDFTPDEAIASVVALRHRRDGLIGLGSRVAPRPAAAHIPQ